MCIKYINIFKLQFAHFFVCITHTTNEIKFSNQAVMKILKETNLLRTKKYIIAEKF